MDKMPSRNSLTIAIWSVKIFIQILYLPILLARLFKRPKKCPPVEDKTLLITASKLAKRIRKQQITSSEIVEAYISRIKAVNPLINAVIEDRFEEARKDAQKADDFVQNSGLTEEEIESKYPLLGIPMTVKGSIAVEGMRHSAGRIDHSMIAKDDAVAVKRARDAGAIPLLISNVPELCLNWETSNKLIGTTANPYDTTRTPAGSSGGEASLLGCGASLIGIGSDIAGSLRLPAHCCGIWGHKPSPHVVSCVGHYPDCKNKDDWNSFFTLGPMARYSTDLKLFLNIIAEPDMKNILKLDATVDVKKIKVYYMESSRSLVADRVDGNVINTIQKVIAHFDVFCEGKCTEVTFPLMKYCLELSYLLLLNIDEVENVFEGKGDGAYSELFRFLSRRSQHELTSICYGVLRRNVHFIPVKSMNRIHRAKEKLRNDFMKLLGDDGVLIMPTSQTEATYQGDAIRKLFNHGGLSIFNALGFPVTNCPIAFSSNGLPIGIQVAAAPNCDRLTLSVAEELERAFGGWRFE